LICQQKNYVIPKKKVFPADLPRIAEPGKAAAIPAADRIGGCERVWRLFVVRRRRWLHPAASNVRQARLPASGLVCGSASTRRRAGKFSGSETKNGSLGSALMAVTQMTQNRSPGCAKVSAASGLPGGLPVEVENFGFRDVASKSKPVKS